MHETMGFYCLTFLGYFDQGCLNLLLLSILVNLFWSATPINVHQGAPSVAPGVTNVLISELINPKMSCYFTKIHQIC